MIRREVPVTILDDWDREHFSGSLCVEEKELNIKLDEWVYFHSLVSKSLLPLYAFHRCGKEHYSFEVVKFDPIKYPWATPIETQVDFSNVLHVIYPSSEIDSGLSYSELYETYLNIGEEYISALKTYFMGQDIGFHRRLPSIDIQYWQIVMLISAMEALLPKPIFCAGECASCRNKINHPTDHADKMWNELLFNHIKDKTIRKQYRLVFNSARIEIRNHTVHNGLMPSASHGNTLLHDGVTEYTTEKAVGEYKDDNYSLETLVEQLKEVCRYILLNQLIEKDIFPPLKSVQVHQVTIFKTPSNRH
jgi:hypothetical protein